MILQRPGPREFADEKAPAYHGSPKNREGERMQSLRAIVTICGLLYGTTAFAQDPSGDPNAQTPPAGTATATPTAGTQPGDWSSFLQRPLILNPLLAEPEFNVGVGNVSIGGASSTGEALNIG